MLRVEIQSAEPVADLFCSGRIVLGVEAETLRCMVSSRLEPQLVLHMASVSAIDAAGLGLLVELHHWAQKRHASLMIADPSIRVEKLLALTKLDCVLPVRSSDQIDSPQPSEDEWRTMTA